MPRIYRLEKRRQSLFWEVTPFLSPEKKRDVMTRKKARAPKCFVCLWLRWEGPLPIWASLINTGGVAFEIEFYAV